MWYLYPEIVASYHQRMHRQSQLIHLCKVANINQTSFLCRTVYTFGEGFVFIGLYLKRISKNPVTQNGISIFYEYS
jgi:hypothetical protein